MKLESIHLVNNLIKRRKELLQEKQFRQTVENFEEYRRLNITVKIYNETFWNERSIFAEGVKITPYEAEHLFAMVKTYNEEELIRVEQELERLGVEIEESKWVDTSLQTKIES